MKLERNEFKWRLKQGSLEIGLWTSLGSSTAVEVLAECGFSWLLIDMEHSPNELPDVLLQLRAMAKGTAQPVVRPAWNDPVVIKRLLDVGANTLLIPFIQDEHEAAAAVRAVRYPPRGARGVTGAGRASRYGRASDYFARADDEVCLLVQVETREALERLEAIATVDGVDGVFVGPSDLAASLGHLGDPLHPEVQAVLQDAAQRLRSGGKSAGILTSNVEDADRYIAWGYRFVAVGTDIGVLSNNASRLAARFQ